jgi:hypothetical protein
MEIIASLDLLARSFAGIVVAISLGIILVMWLRTLAFERALSEVGISAYESRGTSNLERELRRQFVRRRGDGTLLLREPPDVTLEDWLEREVHHHRSFEAGGWITGIALMGTFFLIALVLFRDVGPAIKDASDMTSLSRAVTTMGGKFLVSLLGILGSIGHAVVRGTLLKKLQPRLLEASERLSQGSMMIAEFHAETAELAARSADKLAHELSKQHAQTAAQLDTLTQSLALAAHSAQGIFGAIPQQHSEVLRRMMEVKTSVDRLQSIEVSVKDIGDGLAESLQKMVQNDIVDAIGRNLEDLADKVLDEINVSFSKNLNEQLSLVNDELRKIEAAVSSQAQGQVEELLTKLSDAVSGGFTSESSNMKDALTRFSEVIPALEQQMRTLLLSAAEDQGRRDAQRSQVSEQLFAQLERVTSTIAQQQTATVNASSELRALAAEVQSTMTQSVASANQQILERSRISLEDLTGAVRSATGDASAVYRDLVREVTASASLLREARADTEASAQHLSQSATAVQSQVRAMVDGMTALRSVSDALTRAVEGSRAATQESNDVLRVGKDIIRQQQQFLEDLSSRWPALTTQYLSASDQSFSAIATAWDTQARRIEESVERIGKGFAGSAADFAGAVEELTAAVSKLNPAATAARARTT